MRPSALRCLAALFFLGVIPAVRAQESPNLPPPPAGLSAPGRQSLLLQDAVQGDLGLSEKQKSSLNSLQAGLGQKSRDLFQMAQENGSDPQEFREAMSSLHREYQASLVRVLDKNQKARLAQIELQREGFMAASRSEIAGKLKLNAQQTKKIKTILEEMRRETLKAMPGMLGALQPAEGATKSSGTGKTRKATGKTRRPAASNGAAGGNEMDEMGGAGGMPGAGDGENGFFNGGFAGGGPPGGLPDFLKPENQAAFAKFQEAQQANRAAASEKIGEVLTAEQKAAFEKLTGKPFDFTKLKADQPSADAAAEGEAKPEEVMKKAQPAPKTQAKSKFKKADR